MRGDKKTGSKRSLTRRGYLATAAVMLGAGCSQSTSANATAERISSTDSSRNWTPGVSRNPSSQVRGFDEAWRVGDLNRIMDVANGAVFASMGRPQRRRMARIEIADGTISWETTEPVTFVNGTATNNLLVGGHSDHGQVYALDQVTGNLRWEQTIEGELPYTIGASEETVVIATKRDRAPRFANGYLHALDSETGEKRFTKTVPTEPDSIRVEGTTAFYRAEGGLHAFDIETGEKRWASTSAVGPGAVSGSVIAYPTTTGSLVGRDIKSGKQRYLEFHQFQPYNSFLYSDGTANAFALTERESMAEDHVHVFETATGEHRWSKKKGAIRNVYLQDGRCYILDQALEAYDLETGQLVGRVEPETTKLNFELTADLALVANDELVAYRLN